MAKKVKIMEACIITSDDKGQRSLVGKAKEALTTFSKNKIDVTIMLDKTSKEDAEKFLKENNVPYKELATVPEDFSSGKEKFDACIIPEGNVVMLRDDWTWCMDNLVDKLYRKNERPAQKSEQEKMDDKFKQYKEWADQANKHKGQSIG